MEPHFVHRLIADMIPELFPGEKGPHESELWAGPDKRFYSVAPLSEDMRDHIRECLGAWERLRPTADWKGTQALEQEWLRQQFAERWIARRTKLGGWSETIDYFRRLNGRTRENRRVRKNVIIERTMAAEEAIRLDDESLFTGLDWLGGAPRSYFRTDEKLRIKSLEATTPACAPDEVDPDSFVPIFLRPLALTAGPDNVVVSATEAGDLLVANSKSLIATRRRGKWLTIDAQNVIGNLSAIMQSRFVDEGVEPKYLARLAIQLMLEMSYARHGGMIIFDTKANLENYIVKRDETSEWKTKSLVSQVHFRRRSLRVSDVVLLTELSHIDGALIFDPEGDLINVGAMVRPHPGQARIPGARTAAADAAARFGATVIKASADGAVSMHFPLPKEFPGQVFTIEI